MLIYEVNLEVNSDTEKEFKSWLDHHIVELLRTPGFKEAKWYALEQDKPGKVLYSVHYYVTDEAALDSYLKNHAPRFRADGLERFPGKYTAHRRVLTLVKKFSTQ